MSVLLEDVMMLIEKAHSEEDRIIVVFDEFQEIHDIAPMLDKQLRAMMQTQKNINYIMLGSQESMMTEIFEDKKSPFYHFGQLMRLGKLPREDFYVYLSERLKACFPERYSQYANAILDFTDCHPYYSQQLAATLWQIGMLQPEDTDPIASAMEQIVMSHSLDYERIWTNLNRTNKWIMQRLATDGRLQTGEYHTSTLYSALKKLQKSGYVVYNNRYEIEDPFYKQWIIREM